ncbi:putative RNA-binding EIF1AD [Brachionus plicatilis]|uniref:Probable RNA-binding protein EIF1AD n=1 Tax=Brachionus plicatilis TaxID=10195 RepID=A0A3M7P7T3_BRAPC|nr:putative RNA-binding EIF1AD [Brachionus plicatilis]
MSAATKKKHVFLETINNYSLPTDNQTIVRIKGPRGNNLHDVETASGETFIVSMPVKFRKSVWTKRGDFVIVEPIEEGNKVKAEIVQILNKDNIKHIKSEGMWPKEFEITEDAVEKDGYNIDRDMLPSSSEEESDESDKNLDKD